MEDQTASNALSPYELIFRATNDVLYDLDVRLGTVVWNDALYDQYGYRRTATVGTLEWWTQRIHPEDALAVENHLTEWLESKSDIWQMEYRFARADGGYNYVRDRGFVMRDGHGEAIRIIGSLLDMTRDHELDRAKDEFISLVSHQMRTPLTVVRTYGEMLTAGTFGTLAAEQQASVERMTKASVRLIELVSTILDVSKIEMRGITVQAVPTRLNDLIVDTLKELEPAAAAKGVRLQFKPLHQADQAVLDPLLFRQVLHNFVTNSIRYTRPQRGLVAVRLIKTGKNFRLRVEDNGIGIPKAAQSRIFQRFYRAHNAENVEQHGNGLGLYLVQLIAQAYDGKVWFTSVANKSTSFYFEFPAGHSSTP